MIKCGRKELSSLIVTSILGPHGDSGNFPLNLLPAHRAVVKVVLETGTTVIAKSATLPKRSGNYRWWAPWRCIKYVRSPETGKIIGLINAFDLTNDGVAAAAYGIKKSIEKGFKVVPSYAVEFMKQGVALAMSDVSRELREAVEIFRDELGPYFWMLEVDVSCSNTGEMLAENTDKILIVARYLRSIFEGCISFKLGPEHSVEMAIELEAIGIDIVHVLNAFPHRLINPDKFSPLASFGGGAYSGRTMFDRALAINTEFRRKLKMRMILGGGISDRQHIKRYVDMLEETSGSKEEKNSLSICSAVRSDPEETIEMLRSGKYLFG